MFGKHGMSYRYAGSAKPKNKTHERSMNIRGQPDRPCGLYRATLVKRKVHAYEMERS